MTAVAAAPAPGAAPVHEAGFPDASGGRRLVAYLLDLALTGAIGAGGTLLSGSPLLGGVAVAELLVVQVALEARTGATVGQRAMRLRTVRVGTDESPALGRAVLRALVMGAAHLVVIAPVILSAAGSRDRRGRRRAPHDLIADVQVLDVRRRLAVPPPPPAPRPAAAYTATPVAPAPAPAAPAPQPVAAAPARPALAQPAAAAPAAPQPGAPVAPVVGPAVRLVLPDGQVVPVDADVYLGRAPTAPQDPGARLVTLADPQRQLSRTHARFGLAGETLWVEDLGSGNGTSLRRQDGRNWRLTPEQRIAIPEGAGVLLAELEIRIIRA
ncbi:RDD family protein [Homoserinibacter sp. YIM 151385]|uniref:RDD family protein n=1 Tax=Homoserinibacter sp. YIM 151385 TaxID=2985506 RepID=UPI0022F0772A|nr:RDD family protein [Homoserinibacter sp. YIM 151385]WBU38688.1 RDD family protein [Homoserinibacter sp. YIM 151385]